ncbi:glycosyltransferase [Panacibacter microcysteis]|nr:glycosyltransferase [Panacibacter microcysteis]
MWTIVTYVAIILVVLYCLLILLYTVLFTTLKLFVPQQHASPLNSFSIIIPARNEAANIAACVQSVLANNYPGDMFEVIVIDDFSTDSTAAIVQRLQQQNSNVRLLQLKDFIDSKQNSYKKKAIELAVNHATHQWIITTDADCFVPETWLQTFDAYISTTGNVFVAAPVRFTNNNRLISVFQCLDFISLQGITAAAVNAGMLSMCNGANLAYKKDAFFAVDGFRGVDNIASGDDMLLMHKIRQHFPGRQGYLFSRQVIVSTPPMPDVKSFINQRIRWASKATSYSDKRIFAVLLLVYFVNLVLLLLPLCAIFYTPFFYLWLILLGAKTLAEMIFMLPAAKFFRQAKLLAWFPFMQPLHILYTVISGWLGRFGKYEWKGRSVK